MVIDLRFTVFARSADDVASEPVDVEFTVLPVPGSLGVFLLNPANISRWEQKLEVGIKFPSEPIKKTFNLPLLGTFGGEFQAEGKF
ncbi:hypothetical protein RZS08_21200, partial [Arthrospira platensis SPKY1]|nr:hypothetical protein [Arthrospira platensis SPKY1]